MICHPSSFLPRSIFFRGCLKRRNFTKIVYEFHRNQIHFHKNNAGTEKNSSVPNIALVLQMPQPYFSLSMETAGSTILFLFFHRQQMIPPTLRGFALPVNSPRLRISAYLLFPLVSWEKHFHQPRNIDEQAGSIFR